MRIFSQRIDAVRVQLAPIEASFAQGRIAHSGLTLAIVGQPNVGKSSIFNQLVERERAIVTATPGTTRDLVTERVAIGGIPVNLVDTAGLRESADEAEVIGIQKSREALADADIVLIVLDASAGSFDHEEELIRGLAGRQHIAVVNKIDLLVKPANGSLESLGRALGSVFGEDRRGYRRPSRGYSGNRSWPGGTADQSGMLTNLRQHEAISGAIKSLNAAAESTAQRIPHEMVMLDLYASLRNLDALTGQTTPDDILNQIFSSFCIGK